jgi:hypothetical protein
VDLKDRVQGAGETCRTVDVVQLPVLLPEPFVWPGAVAVDEMLEGGDEFAG